MSAAVYRLKPSATGAEVEIKDGMVIGRNPDCDLVLTGGHPSRRHARLNLKPDGLWVEDLGSANGTFVNGQPIKEPRRVSTGDRVAFDVNEFEVLGPPAAAPAASATVVRRPVEPATVARPAAERAPKPPEPTPAPKAAEVTPAEPPKPPRAEREPKPEREPKAAEAPVAPAKAERAPKPAAEKPIRQPGAWARDDYKGDGSGTKLFGADELKRLQSELKMPQVQAPADAPYLLVASGGSAGKTFKLEKAGTDAKQWEIGSDASRDIVLTDPGVSAFHAKIVNEGNRWKLIDQMSANGTFVNGQKGNISYLKAGDRVRFGTIECTFQLPSGIAAAASGKRTGWIIGAAAFVATAVVLYVVMEML